MDDAPKWGGSIRVRDVLTDGNTDGVGHFQPGKVARACDAVALWPATPSRRSDAAFRARVTLSVRKLPRSGFVQ